MRQIVLRRFAFRCNLLIANLHVVGDDEGDPAGAEEALLEQQEEIEWRLGLDYFERRGAGR